MREALFYSAIVAMILVATIADAADPIRLAYAEGDIAGFSSILKADGTSAIGFIEYRQHRRGDVLLISRVAHFHDGSSDEDRMEAEVGETLRTIRGRTIIRNTEGTATLDIAVDVAAGRVSGFSGLGKNRETYDEQAELTPGTYWGPLLGIVLKNFDENSVDGHLEFHTVVMTPKPRLLDMQFAREQSAPMNRPGGAIGVARFALSVSVNVLLDPIIRLFTPTTSFFMQPGSPPALAGFAGPRNYAGEKIRIE